MRRIPVLPTILVVAAVAVMITLGLWQGLVRLPEKEAQLAQLAANPVRPPVAFPTTPDDRLLFRRTSALCRDVTGISRAGAGSAGYRLIATCRTAAGTPAIKVQLGTTRDPLKDVQWSGGRVSGWISHAPDATPMISRLFSHVPQEMLLVSDKPLAGLVANTRPDISLVPNNHLAYAGQWLFFAALACVIYVLALRRRGSR